VLDVLVDFYRRLALAYGAQPLSAKILFVVALTGLTTVLGMAMVIWLPADHFSSVPGPIAWWRKHPMVRWTGLGLKNLVGFLVLCLGVVMAVPLVPGPGLVFILVGLSLLDFPGKRRMERKLLGFQTVRRFLNDVRKRFGREPLIVDGE
jgi:hypothetical protein